MLTDTTIRNAKPRDKFYKVSDSGGLYLLAKSTGNIGAWNAQCRSAPDSAGNVILRLVAIFGTAVGQDADDPHALLGKERQHPIIE